MFATLPALEADIDNFITNGRFNDALANILVGVHNHCRTPDVARKFLFYPNLDRHIETLSHAVSASCPGNGKRPISSNTLIIASEMYPVGGHSRVIADVAAEMNSPTIVLTDMLWKFRQNPDSVNWLLESFTNATVILLTQTTLWEKCRALHLLTQRLQPQTIFYFNHHEDPIPFAGTLRHAGSRKMLVHHCDHNPSLGNTLASVEHVDFNEEMANSCSSYLNRDAHVLPLYVPEGGKKVFPATGHRAFSVVTSGADHKYARKGDLALQNIIRVSLEVIDGFFFHIGHLDDGWIEEIKLYLKIYGIDPTRFRPVGGVTSLWSTLARIDAHLYIGSAPVGGGRAAIEAQGCGYPVAFFKVADQGPALGVSSLYANNSLGWSNLMELTALLETVAPRLGDLSLTARALYDRQFSRAEFVRVLNQLTEPPTTADL